MSAEKNVLISGTSSGLGRAAAVAFARKGWRVYAGMRDTTQGTGLLDEAGPVADRITVVQLDLLSQDSIHKAVEFVLGDCGDRLDLLLNNAGSAASGFFEVQPDADFRSVMETNFFGTCALTREVLPAMRERRSGRVMTVTSVAAYAASPALSAYVASKRALQGWMESLAVETRLFGISVAVVEPGTYRTAIWENAKRTEGGPDSPYERLHERFEDSARRLVEVSGREPEVGAKAIVALADRKRIPFRNPVGLDARWFFRPLGVVPFRLRARMIGRFSGVGAE
ncbi:SDR family oxidoreductase [Streptomyces sp. NBC_01190]|uniref:SDR family oxidoreductase n=1 Tax=Streptomyces sp. NBC_01190 TaxID=2903767 RepID=UPI00386E8251|nr:SDR family oxidoreductase [Streptomyces sp. NBC_01190]